LVERRSSEPSTNGKIIWWNDGEGGMSVRGEDGNWYDRWEDGCYVENKNPDSIALRKKIAQKADSTTA
jgi:hypothetical protein